jgi:streptogramin lyase
MPRRLVPLVVLVATIASLVGADAAGAVALREVVLPGARITNLAPGRAGTVWYAGAGRLGRLAAGGTGRRRKVRVPTRVSPTALVADGAGGVWFVDGHGGAIGHASARGSVREYRAVAHGGGVAPDGRGHVWFTTGARWIGRMDRHGHVRRFALPKPDTAGNIVLDAVGPVARGRDGTMWFGADGGYGSIGPTGRVRWHVLGQDEVPRSIVVRAGSGVWVLTSKQLTRLPVGHRNDVIVGAVPNDEVFDDEEDRALPTPSSMSLGPRGRLWITMPGSGTFAAATTKGLTTPRGPGVGVGAGPVLLGDAALALDTRGRLWTATTRGVAQIVLGPVCQVPQVVALSEAVAVAAFHDAGCTARVSASGPGTADDRVVRKQGSAYGVVLKAGASVSLQTTAPTTCVFPPGAEPTSSSVPQIAFASDGWATYMCPLAHPIAERTSCRPDRVAVAGDWMACLDASGGGRYMEDYPGIVLVRHLAPDPHPRSFQAQFSGGALPALVVNTNGAAAFDGLAGRPQDVIVLLADGTTRTVGMADSYAPQLSIDATTVFWVDASGTHSAPIVAGP